MNKGTRAMTKSGAEKKKKRSIIIPQGGKVLPEPIEISAARILGKYFKNDVEFIPVTSSKTPDFVIDGVRWELKSPTGKGKYTIQHQFHRATKQSKNIIIDARRCKLHIARIRREVNYQVGLSRGIKRVILIEKSEKVVVIK